KNDFKERGIITETKDCEGRPRQFTQKFSSNDILAEAVLICNKPYFLVSQQGSIKIQPTLEIDDKILVPLDVDSYINKPYSFVSEEEVTLRIENAKNENLDSLYRKTKSVWRKYVDADDFHISLCAADTIY